MDTESLYPGNSRSLAHDSREARKREPDVVQEAVEELPAPYFVWLVPGCSHPCKWKKRTHQSATLGMSRSR